MDTKYTTYTPQELSTVQIDDLIYIGQAAFNVTKKEIVEHIEEADSIILAEERFENTTESSLKPVGFAASKIYDNILYLTGSFVFRPNQGIYQTMRRKAIEESNAKIVATTTQNPKIYKGLKAVLPQLQPTPLGDCDILNRERIAEKLGIPIDEKGVHRRRYGRCLYDYVPRANRDSNLLFDDVAQLNYDRWRCIASIC
jgi:hypothetical protein